MLLGFETLNPPLLPLRLDLAAGILSVRWARMLMRTLEARNEILIRKRETNMGYSPTSPSNPHLPFQPGGFL